MRRSNFGSMQLDFGALGLQQQQPFPSMSSHESLSLTHSPDTSLSLPGTSSPRRSLGGGGGGASGLQRSSRRLSDMSNISRLSTDLGYRYPRDSMGEDEGVVLEGMQNSMWGDLLDEAILDEEGDSR